MFFKVYDLIFFDGDAFRFQQLLHFLRGREVHFPC